MEIKRILVFILIILALGILSVYYPDSNKSVKWAPEEVYVVKVIDGDTFKDDSGQSYRLLGVNTPEKGKNYYSEALNFLKEIEGKNVSVLRDFEDLDKYNRKLRYVFFEDRLINSEILENGFGTSFMIEGLKYSDKLRSAEKSARSKKIGLWIESSDICSDCIELVELNPEEEYFIIKNKCDSNCTLKDWVVKDDANHFFKLNDLSSYETEKYNSEIKVWNDNGDRFFMRDSAGGLVVFYEY